MELFEFLNSSAKTCPSCRRTDIFPCDLIKLFFELDDSKASLNLDEILTNNEKLTKQVKELENKFTKLGTEARDSQVKLKEANEKSKIYERQIQLDNMALAGFKSLKEDAMKEIMKLNEQINNLKLDLLAEKQLRRSFQKTLHGFDPLNENYDTASLETASNHNNGPSTVDTFEPASSVTMMQLDVEAKPGKAEKAPEVHSTFVIPKKIQKSGDEPGFWARRHEIITKAEKSKPEGYRFLKIGLNDLPKLSSATSSSAVPSTSSNVPEPSISVIPRHDITRPLGFRRGLLGRQRFGDAATFSESPRASNILPSTNSGGDLFGSNSAFSFTLSSLEGNPFAQFRSLNNQEGSLSNISPPSNTPQGPKPSDR